MLSALLLSAVLTSSFNWTAVGPERGSVTAIDAAEPMFAGTAQGRLFQKSPDGSWSIRAELGKAIRTIDGSWVLAGDDLYRGAQLVATGINAFALAPSDRRVVYAASSTEVLVSSDGGVTWTRRGGGAVSIAVDAVDGRIVFVVRPDGTLQRSTDAGATWTTLVTGARRVEAHPRRSGTAFAIGDSGRAWRTHDGVTWTELHFLTGDLVFHPTEDRTFYAIDEAGRLFRSTNDGETVSIVHGGPILSLDIDAGGTLFAGFREDGVQRSTDGGETWIPDRRDLLAAEIHTLAASRNGSVVYAGSVTSMFRSLDRGASWESVFTLRLLPGPFRAIAIDESDPQRVWIGAGVSMWFSGDGGVRFNRLLWVPDREPQNIVAAAIDRSDRRALWVLMSQSFLRFETEPIVLHDLTPPRSADARFEVLAVDAVDPRSIWIGGSRVAESLLLHSSDGGQTWTDVSPRDGTITAIYADRFVLAGTSTGRILRSDDGGRTWRASDSGITATAPITSIVAANGSFFAASNGVFASRDGSNWSNVSGSIGSQLVTALAPADLLFAGTAASGVFVQRPVRIRPRAVRR